MKNKRRLVMATNNAGKLREARAIAGDKLEILSLADIGYHHDIPETADTLTGNALIKVRAIKEVCSLDVFADDTGLLVDALDGAPGVYSARYAGDGCTPDDNIDLMLKNMEGIENRHARFCTSIALSIDGEEHVFEGSVEGSIATHRSGSHGFGYDPIFICEETGICFAEMSDEDKNRISHRGRAISAMMKWLSALCMAIFACLPGLANDADWTLYNSFDDKIEMVFDTESKTYFLAQAQLYVPSSVDNQDNLCFLFCFDKDTEELRPYNAQNFLSRSLIRNAYYNAIKKYLLIVYDDLMIDILYDDGTVFPIHALKNYDSPSSKQVRSISFDPENDCAYLATDFGYVCLNDKKHEVLSSGIYNQPLDHVVRAGGYLLVVSEGKIFYDDLSSNHATFLDFREPDWAAGNPVSNLVAISSSKALFSALRDGVEDHFILDFGNSSANPVRSSIGSFQGADIVENKDGLLLTRTSQIVQIDRDSGARTFLPRGEGNYAVPVGSWDLKEAFYAKSRTGIYSERRNDNNEWITTRQPALPNAPAAFRSNFLSYSPQHGMLVNSHGIDQNFSSHSTPNPILLSAFQNADWTPLGIPYFDDSQKTRLTNPCGFAQDPDDPNLFYFGSVLNGMIRYNVKDFSSLLHITRSNDNPAKPGHVAAADPYSTWGNAFMLLYPQFDNKGNLVVTHTNTDSQKDSRYQVELWIWTPEKRKASDSPESFQPFKRLPLEGLYASKISRPLAMEANANRNLVAAFLISQYDSPFVIYDHKGTPDDEADDRQTVVSALYDQDGNVTYHYIYCALEDPSTGLVWVGTDNGVFTLDPALQFDSPGLVNRIKVSRNDGTSLADYLLNGISVNNISIDSMNRKWFSLSNGGIVCTSANGKTILEEITSENSMLPSDNVYATAFNPDSNSLMIATQNGICAYSLGFPSDSAKSDVRVFPNPVRPDYYGWITIDGLEDDALVKITDSAGNIVKEIGPAVGGKIQWDGCDSRLRHVASGVYFVLASSGPGTGSYAEVTKILVVKN